MRGVLAERVIVSTHLDPFLSLGALQRDLGSHLLLVHYSPKGADATCDAIDAGLGSTALPGTVDRALFLRCFPDGRLPLGVSSSTCSTSPAQGPILR